MGRTAASDFSACLAVDNQGETNAMFRLNQSNGFVGSGGCAGCHGDKAAEWIHTGHATAYDAIANMPPAVRVNCLPCHTVGVNQPTGFVDIETTPHLSDVGCENCHGPAGWHKYSDHDLIRPAVSIAAEVCGGCHTDAHHPTYDEWLDSHHVEVSGSVANYILHANPATGFGRQMSCGPCHSGPTRLAMLANYKDQMAGRTNFLTLPSAEDAAGYAVTCAVCHDPHVDAHPYQLRNPLFSTNFFALATANVTTEVYRTNFAGVVTTNTHYVNSAFVEQYDPDIQICGQCHNNETATIKSADELSARANGYHTPPSSVIPVPEVFTDTTTTP